MTGCGGSTDCPLVGLKVLQHVLLHPWFHPGQNPHQDQGQSQGWWNKREVLRVQRGKKMRFPHSKLSHGCAPKAHPRMAAHSPSPTQGCPRDSDLMQAFTAVPPIKPREEVSRGSWKQALRFHAYLYSTTTSFFQNLIPTTLGQKWEFTAMPR